MLPSFAIELERWEPTLHSAGEYDESALDDTLASGKPLETNLVDDATQREADAVVDVNAARTAAATVTPVPASAPALATPLENAASLVSIRDKVGSAGTPSGPGGSAPPATSETTSKVTSLPELKSTPEGGTAAHSLREISLVVEAFLEGRPLAHTQVYSLRRASGRIVKLGETDAAGLLKSDHPAALLGETLLVRNVCCVSLLRPLTIDPRSKETRKLRVDLTSGVSHDFVAVQTSYGQPRSVEKVALQLAGRTLEITGPAGAALVGAKNLSAGLAALEVGSADTLPTRKAVALPIASTTEEAPHLIEVARASPRTPQVGLIELSDGEVVHAETHLRGEPLHRRARRDFLSRFVQEKTLRPLIFQEVKRYAESAGVPVETLLRRGWDLTPLAGEIDFVATFEAQRGNFGGVRARLFDSMGTVLWDEVFPYDAGEASPELAGRAAFDGLLHALPFEFAALSVTPLDKGKAVRVALATGKDHEATLTKGDMFQRVGKGEACEGRLEADGTSAVVQGVCAENTAVGDLFQRKRRGGLAGRL
jgi:hypothetical protein